MANNVLLRRGTGDMMNKVLEDLYNTVIEDFNTTGNIKPTESNFGVIAGARKVITGLNVAQYFMVEPLIDELLEVLPKPTAKKVFIEICEGIGARIDAFYKPYEANNELECAVHRNREKLKKLGIPEEQWAKFGGTWPEEIYLLEGKENG